VAPKQKSEERISLQGKRQLAANISKGRNTYQLLCSLVHWWHMAFRQMPPKHHDTKFHQEKISGFKIHFPFAPLPICGVAALRETLPLCVIPFLFPRPLKTTKPRGMGLLLYLNLTNTLWKTAAKAAYR
jgi:hypothetical protein